MVVLGEKLRLVPWATQPGREVESGALFLESSAAHTTTAHRKRKSGIRGLAWEAYVLCVSSFPIHCVHRFELPRLLDE
jgi:hypothetical protein